MQTGDWPRYPFFRDGLPPVTLCSGVHMIITCHLRVQREPGLVTPFPRRTLVTSPRVTVSYSDHDSTFETVNGKGRQEGSTES